LQWLELALARLGLQLRGHFLVRPEDGLAAPDPLTNYLLVLIGNVGSDFWPFFANSEEFQDGQAHPLDRWSLRIGSELASQCRGQAFYPFGGPPHYSFLRWAAKAEALGASPMGLRLHPKFGLWHAYRFALQIPFVEEASEPGAKTNLNDEVTSPSMLSEVCLSCSTQACLKTCPVNAFTIEGYDVETCARYLHTAQDQGRTTACAAASCQARLACPVGENYRYTTAHGQFHMRQFMQTHRPPGTASVLPPPLPDPS
jgi:hypothetical protein